MPSGKDLAANNTTTEGGEVQEIIDNVRKSSTGIFDLLLHSPMKMNKANNPFNNAGNKVSLELNANKTCSLDFIRNDKAKKLLSVKQRNAIRQSSQNKIILNGQSQGVASFSSSPSESEDSISCRIETEGYNVQQWFQRYISEISEEEEVFKDPPHVNEQESQYLQNSAGLSTLIGNSQVLNEEIESWIKDIQPSNQESRKRFLDPPELSLKRRQINSATEEKTRIREESKESLEQEIFLNWHMKVEPGFQNSDFRSCPACKDRFYLDTGFRDHLARKTVKINFTCHTCRSSLLFYNRCQLIQHLQSHGIDPVLDYMLGLTTTVPIGIEETEFHLEYTKSDNSENRSTISGNASDDKLLLIDISGSRPSVGLKLVQTLGNDNLLENSTQTVSDFTSVSTMSSSPPQIAEITLSPSRIENEPSEIEIACPAGMNIMEIAEAESSNCVDFKLQKNEEEPSILKLEENDASKEFFKGLEPCQYCEKLLPATALKRHEVQCFAKASNLLPGYCLICKTDFTNSIILAKHGLDHTKEGILVCLMCNNRRLHPSSLLEIDQNKTLRNHLYHCHGQKYIFPYNCTLCDSVLDGRKSLEFHLFQHHKNNVPITKDFKKDMDDPELNHHLLETDTVEVFYCPKCKGREFNSPIALSRHFEKVHSIILATNDLNRLKLKKVSSAKRYSARKQPSLIIPTSSSANNNNKSRTQEQVSILSSKKLFSRPYEFPFPQRKKFKRSTPNKSLVKSGVQESQDSNLKIETKPIKVISKARLEDGTLQCLKCKEFSTTSEEEFYSHIKSTHIWSLSEFERRTLNGAADKTDFWCPECDMTFVTKPALKMHFRVNHEFIEDVKIYLEKIGYEGDVPLLENQCEVCYVQFEESFELQKHFRTHGLAFLRLEQQRKAQTVKDSIS